MGSPLFRGFRATASFKWGLSVVCRLNLPSTFISGNSSKMPGSRGVGTKKRNAKAALSAMRRAREEGRSGLENIEEQEDAPVYDVVNEEEY